ncbi:MAG: GNAT family N-acetyltransferase [Caldilineaceae bacterium]
MYNDLQLRPFAPTDQAAAKALILRGLEEHWGVLDLTKNSDLNDIAASYADGVFLVALRGNALVGTGALIPETDGGGRIVRMSVATELRRHGLGKAILDRLCTEARQRGYRQLVLETTKTWDDAVNFYTRYGFQTVHIDEEDRHFRLALADQA